MTKVTNAVEKPTEEQLRKGFYPNAFELLKDIHKFDYFNFTSIFMSMMLGKLMFLYKMIKELFWAHASCDHLFNKKINSEKLKNKKNVKSIIKNLNKDCDLILYSPTWRPHDLSMTLPMFLLKKFNLNDFNKFLNVNNLQLIISTHKIVQSEIDLSNYDQVHLLPPDPLLDINNILPEINLLITDYSQLRQILCY